MTDSGAFMDRPALEQTLEAVRQRKVGLVMVHDADRLTRDPLDLLNIIKVLSDAGVRLELVNGPSPDSPGGAAHVPDGMGRENRAEPDQAAHRR